MQRRAAESFPASLPPTTPPHSSSTGMWVHPFSSDKQTTVLREKPSESDLSHNQDTGKACNHFRGQEQKCGKHRRVLVFCWVTSDCDAEGVKSVSGWILTFILITLLMFFSYLCLVQLKFTAYAFFSSAVSTSDSALQISAIVETGTQHLFTL